ncbi:ABC transporter substrate-binding protein [Roseibium aggregatum]|jgi:multiple sugar transport system substrate-binding protein|uniref:ABC transporter substrate-binding protein n=1 Tax=Roseibium aggregatum TaxID=187304 RepID=UPI001E4F1C9F|nr:ABC transporter substrate-binding protein [Roseibium aggregatum]UES41966.1 extracellular solute-binding protein [Roseibium aggregatum]
MNSAIRAAALAAVTALTAVSAAKADTELSLWSHWADQDSKIEFIQAGIEKFEAAHPGVTVKPTWYQKNPLFAALKGALQAGQGPDVFYCEPAQTEYIDNGFLLPLNDHLEMSNIEGWAADTWRHDGKVYALPLEAYTVEIYFNTETLDKLGFDLPDDGQLSAAEFKKLVEAAAGEGITPIVQGAGDRPFPGAYLTHEVLLKKIGIDAYGDLLAGTKSWSDPDVMEALDYMESLIEAGAYPRSFATMKLGESHYYFYSNPGGLMLPMGSWYTSRAFNAPDQGGQPEGFPLGIMQAPALDGSACPECKTANIGGSFCVNAESSNAELAAEFLNAFADPEMGNLWLQKVLVQTGIKSDASTVSGPHAGYFKMLEAADKNNKFFQGTPHAILKGQCLETFKQVINVAFPAGQVGASQAAQMMDQACSAG